MRVVHYLNQFFGGQGGEEAADMPPRIQDGAVGPGRLLEQVLENDGHIVHTIIAGDNYAAEHLESLTEQVINHVKAARAELFVAGPCFEAGRYGMVAGALCQAVQAELGIPVVTGMAVENPGVDLSRQELYIVDSGASVSGMREVLSKMAHMATKLAQHQNIGRPVDEGYIPRGMLRDEVVPQTAAERLVHMLVAKTTGQPFESEFTPPAFAPVPPPAPVTDLSKARVAIVTDGGLVPRGNPDNIAPYAATNWGAYDISALDDLRGEHYEVSHRGYDTRYVEQDPDRLVPVDVLRDMEKTGIVGKLHEQFISTSGLANPLANSRRLGHEIAEKLKREGVDAVILTST
jgi:glycine reductase complex component B subunit gamma